MNEQLIERIVPEIRTELVGLALREILQLSEDQFVIALEGNEFRLLFVSIEPREPRIYLIKRRLRDLKKQKQNPSKFVVDAGHALFGMRLTNVSKLHGDRIVEFRFESAGIKFLIAQLTGRSANVFVLDGDRRIISAAKKPGKGQRSLEMNYAVPTRAAEQIQSESRDDFNQSADSTLSQTLDAYYLGREEQERFESLATAARKKNHSALAKLKRLTTNLESDVSRHGDPEKWKRFGDLLLANQSTAQREADSIIVPDLFDDAAPLVTIEADENDSIPEAAEKYFRKYTKAKTAVAEIGSRLKTVKEQLGHAEREAEHIEKAIVEADEEFLANYIGKTRRSEEKPKRRREPRLPAGVRSFHSSDGFEILVGKKARDNDFLSFRIANSRDTWMHAADYPGSHVVIRNPDRKELPQRTLIQAAQLAAFYSQGNKQTKAAVNYTEKKFVNKPTGAAPGLVRLASFKTIMVEPVFPKDLQT